MTVVVVKLCLKTTDFSENIKEATAGTKETNNNKNNAVKSYIQQLFYFEYYKEPPTVSAYLMKAHSYVSYS